jgi:hypothetical protein
LIAGNGRFPFLVLEAARSQGIEMVVAAIREETSPDIEQQARTVHWMSLGQLGKLIKTFKAEGVTRAIMAGQVKHKQIFSGIIPDLKMMQLLASLATRNTDSLIGAVARVLEEEGIHLVESTVFLQPLLPQPGVLTQRSPRPRSSRISTMATGWRANWAASMSGRRLLSRTPPASPLKPWKERTRSSNEL